MDQTTAEVAERRREYSAEVAGDAPPGRIRVPMSLLQQQIWSLEKSAPSPGFYNDSVHHRFVVPVDTAVLTDALAYVVDRHEALRTRFPTDAAGPYQSIRPALAVDLALTDLGGVRATDRPRELARLASQEHQAPFDVAGGPLLRARLFLLDNDTSELALTLHHLISDATSLSLLSTDVVDAYTALRAGRRPELAPLVIQYADFAVWQQKWFNEKREQAQRDYWASKLVGVTGARSLPYSSSGHGMAAPVVDLTVAPHIEGFLVADDLRARLVHLARVAKAGLSVVCLAAVEALMALSTGDTDTLVITSYSGRDRPELEPALGLFGGLGFLRTDLSGNPPFETVLRRARASMLGLLENHHLPIVTVIDMLATRGTNLELSSVPVAFHFFHASERWEPGVTVVARPPEGNGPLDSEDEAAKPLDFQFFDDGRHTWGRLGCHADCFEPGMIDTLLADLHRLLEAVSEDPLIRLSDLPVTVVEVTR